MNEAGKQYGNAKDLSRGLGSIRAGTEMDFDVNLGADGPYSAVFPRKGVYRVRCTDQFRIDTSAGRANLQLMDVKGGAETGAETKKLALVRDGPELGKFRQAEEEIKKRYADAVVVPG